MPKGTYILNFHHRSSVPPSASLANWRELERKDKSDAQPRRNWPIVVLTLSFLLAAATAIIVFLLADRSVARAERTIANGPAPAPFAAFWNGFLVGAEEPWVIFSNGAFVGRPETGMRYYDSACGFARSDSRSLHRRG